jgi:hypothetical protein
MIAHALEARGLRIVPTGTSMRVSIPPDTVTFSLTEQIEKRNHVPTMEELAKENRLRKKEATPCAGYGHSIVSAHRDYAVAERESAELSLAVVRGRPQMIANRPYNKLFLSTHVRQ